MTDLNKEIELCNQSFEKYWDDFCEAYGNGFDRSLAKLFFANAWGEAKAQAVPEDCAIVPKELHIEIALKMAKERVLQQPLGKDPVWNELVEQVYKDNLQAEQCRLIRDYREMVKASESGAEG